MSSEKNKNNNRFFTEPYGGNFRALVGGQISVDSSSTPLYGADVLFLTHLHADSANAESVQ